MQSNAVAAEAIRHVVVLMLENHSFDQMLGCFKQVYPELEGVDPGAGRHNQDTAGRIYPQAETTERIMFLDPHHEVEHVKAQLADGNSGFVKDFESAFGASSAEARSFVMGYYPLDFLPGFHALARHFTIYQRFAQGDGGKGHERIAHLFWLAKQCRDKAGDLPTCFRRTMYLRRAKYLEARARRARLVLAVSVRAGQLAEPAGPQIR
jgi:phospholipase C